MSAVPVTPALEPARRPAELAHSRFARVAFGAAALAVIGVLLARRIDLATLAASDIV